jgi:UDP-GlcNAc3NAcA epimerase
LKIATIVGARPQFIKASMVSKEIAKYENISETIIHTGQHFDENMSRIFFEEMGIPKPDHNLEINTLSHGSMTGRMLEKIEKLILSEKPDWVLVYGDTNSTLAGTLAAVKLGVSVAHVEAGLRSFNMRMPEEINRILTDRVSNLLFCPTEVAVNNLEKEGIVSNGNRVVLSGDVMYDAHLHFMDNAKKMSSIMRDLGLEDSPFLLCTIHRPDNTDDQIRLENILRALNSLSSSHRIIFPMHPRTRTAITKNKLEVLCEMIPPVSYLDMIELVRNCSLVITDSGGLQKEAYFSGKYCVTLRDETEWVELVDKGVVFISGADTNAILTLVEKLISKEGDFKERLYGNGEASAAVVEELARA